MIEAGVVVFVYVCACACACACVFVCLGCFFKGWTALFLVRYQHI